MVLFACVMHAFANSNIFSPLTSSLSANEVFVMAYTPMNDSAIDRTSPGFCFINNPTASDFAFNFLFSSPVFPYADMSSDCMSCKRSSNALIFLNACACPGAPMRLTDIFWSQSHPVFGSKSLMNTCPSVMDINSSTNGRGCVYAFSGTFV